MIRYRFAPDQIEFLEEFRWWDRDLEWLKANHRLFRDIETFEREIRKGTGT